MSRSSALDVEDVLGLLSAPRGPVSVSEDDTAEAVTYSARYAGCARCKWIGPCLITFRSRLDWSPEIPEYGPVRAAIEQLRRESGRAAINLCTSCIARLTKQSQQGEHDDGRLPLVFS